MKTNKIKKICCIGAGYVGGPTMAVFADRCPNLEIKVVDINKLRIAAWNNKDVSKLPIFEPGLSEIIQRRRDKNLFFTSNLEESIGEADLIFISVNTPIKTKGIGAGKASDLKWVEASSRQIAKYSKGYTIVVEKSTLPVKTAETIKNILIKSQINNNKESKSFSVLSNPEFLSEGNAIKDLVDPDRVLIGGEDETAIEALATIYSNWIPKNKIIRTNLWSSELSKLTSNAFLAQRISSINSISALCEATGADILQVCEAVGMDSRIGNKFLKPSPGFGGSCFKKDILNLVYLCDYYNLEEVGNYWQGVVDINDWQRLRISRLIVDSLFGNVSEKKITILGFAFKANTNDTRESSSINICKDLLIEGAELSIYDPKVEKNQIEKDLNSKPTKRFNKNDGYGIWDYYETIEESIKDSDAIVVLTEWDEFMTINWRDLYSMMRKPSWIFDTRNCIDIKEAKNAGFNIWAVGSSIFKD